ncbi:MAG: sigma-54-dependent transcriptional regulator [Opitutaceae bacterium]
MKTRARLLLIEDDRSLAESLAKALRSEGHEVDHARAGDAGLERVAAEDYDVVLTDMRLPGAGGLEVVRRINEQHKGLPVILLTAHGTAETAIEATKRGAFDYLLKPFSVPDLLAIITRALEQTRTGVDDESQPAPPVADQSIIGRSRAMQEVFKEIGRVAPQEVTVLIRGETGTGKEMIARAIWRHSGREKKPFLGLNCAAIPDTLLESELFGHEKGAFTGADARRIGLFQQAEGGVLFLDEIGDVSPATQVRLLRVLQERVIQRVGGRESIPIDVRVLAATHSNLEEAIAAGTFREDLFYRLSTVQIRVPALRDRIEDVPLLARHFIACAAVQQGTPAPALREDAVERLMRHTWPGNVRELENVVRRALIATRGFDLSAPVIEEALSGALPHAASEHDRSFENVIGGFLRDAIRRESGDAHATAVQFVETELLRQAMRMAGGNKSKAARWLGLSRLTLREKLQRSPQPEE